MHHHHRHRIAHFAVRQLSQISAFKETPQPITDLGRIFDSPTFWDRHRLSQSTTSTGLFGYDQLASTQRHGFVQAAKATVEQVSRIISLVCAQDSSMAEKRKAVKRLDLLSDMVCSVVDAAQLIMAVHPDPKVAKDAASAHAILSNFLSQLNTNTPLYQVRITQTLIISSNVVPLTHCIYQ